MMMEVRTAETRGEELTMAPSSTAADLSEILAGLEGREASEVILSCIKLKKKSFYILSSDRNPT